MSLFGFTHLAYFALIVCACAELTDVLADKASLKIITQTDRQARALGKTGLPSGCLFEGAWHKDGTVVTTHEACLHCVCAHGALSCRRRACAPLPDPPPPRCHVRHRRGACCPELHCPDGVTLTELGGSARFADEDLSEILTPSSVNHACVEGGTVYAAGSALTGGAACEACFCLRGRRRCVRPRCLPQPPGCVARPAAGACCPQRYYCHHDEEQTHERNGNDCEVEGRWVQEGDRVSGGNCTACFCLRGTVRCQPLACAPALHGCVPLLRPGDCCPHQYKCEHHGTRAGSVTSHMAVLSHNSLASTRNDDRALHSSKSAKIESTTNKIVSSLYTIKNTPVSSATKNHITTTKVKRKTNEPPPSSSHKPDQNSTTKADTTTQKPFTAAKLIALETSTTDEPSTTEKTIDQPDGTVKIIINGTINCTAELSTSLPLSVLNDTERIQMEAMPRIPIVNIEAQTYSPNDIITDRNVNGEFDENDTFTINVTSSLSTNTSHSTSRPVVSIATKVAVPTDLVDTMNSSKKTKGDYDYDYTEPTLPPSLPNLKIIPFVAADAVVDDEPAKEPLNYPILEREDKFPVYYPSVNKEPSYPTSRDEVYQPTQYPIFLAEKESFPPVDITSNRYPGQDELGSAHDYTVSTSLGSHLSDVNNAKPVTKVPTTSSTYEIDTPAVNLFSPPVETEGGFIPKGPGIIDEYYAVYPSTPSGPAVPHLTTSMQLDVTKDNTGECITDDGQRLTDGDTISVGCLECACAWGNLRCIPRPCPTPPHCKRLSILTDDDCCGQIVCETENKTTSTLAPTKNEVKVNKTRIDQIETGTSIATQPITEVTPPRTETTTTMLPTTSTSSTTTEKGIVEEIGAPANNNRTTKPPIQKVESAPNTTIAHITTTPTPKFTTTTAPARTEINDTSSQEYEDDDDEGFSFGSVLKLLLSDSYESTTTPPYKKPPTKPPQVYTTTTTTTRRPTTVVPFIPLPPHPYIPPKKATNLHTVNRIDHLVLGEATAIKTTTSRPMTNKTTKRPIQKTTTEKRPDVKDPGLFTSHEGPRPPNLGLPLGSGLLKLAGCNIYGRMYRVGRIIAELSTPCQECWCTEFGVQCKALSC